MTEIGTTRRPDRKPPANQVAAGLPAKKIAELLVRLESGKPPAFGDAVVEAFTSVPKTEEAQAVDERAGDRPRDEKPNLAPKAVYGLLRFLTDESESRGKWQEISELATAENRTALDRDASTWRLWGWLEDRGKSYVTSRSTLLFHRHRIFDWFLGRYDLRRARALFADGRAVRNAHWLLLGGLLLAAFAEVTRWGGDAAGPGPILARPAVLAVTVTYLVVTSWLAHRFRQQEAGRIEAITLAGQSLIPRLAGASAAGVVILASSEELARFVIAGAGPWRLALLVGASLLYLLLEMSRRIHPVPRLGRLLLHGLDVSATAFAHSLALALVTGPGLVLIAETGQPLTGLSLLNLAAVLFAIGLVVNLIWAEQPITQPL